MSIRNESFIHSGYFYSASSSSLLLRGAFHGSTDTVLEFHAEAPQATASDEDLPKVLRSGYRAGVEPTTLRTIDVDSTNESLRTTMTSSHKLT